MPAVLASLAAPLILYLVARTAAVALQPTAAALLPPKDVAPLLRPLVGEAADPRRRVSPEIVALSRAAAVSAPLAFEPFFIEARAADQAGRLTDAIRLLEEAKRRRPTAVLIRIQLLAYYQRAGRAAETISELNFVLQRSPEAQRYLLPELAKMIRDRRGRVALAAVLAQNPSWRADFLAAAREQNIAPQHVLELIQLVRSRRPGVDVSGERALYFHRLARAGDYPRARAGWLELLPVQDRARHALLFDGAFRGLRGDPPFGWTLNATAAGRAEAVGGGGGQSYLDVAYFGGSNATLAEQTLALPPGRYRVGFQARSETEVQHAELYWQILCLPGGAPLTRVRIAGLRPEYRRLEATLVVPGRCRGQQLELVALPGDIAAAVAIHIAAMDIARD